MTEDLLVPPFASKIAVVVRDDLESWQRLNVTAFLISGVTAAHPELVGEPYEDADGQRYLALLGMPVLVFEATAEQLQAARAKAAQRELPLAVYTRDMFATGHDADNRAAVRAVAVGGAGPGRHRAARSEERRRQDHQGCAPAPMTRAVSPYRPGGGGGPTAAGPSAGARAPA